MDLGCSTLETRTEPLIPELYSATCLHFQGLERMIFDSAYKYIYKAVMQWRKSVPSQKSVDNS